MTTRKKKIKEMPKEYLGTGTIRVFGQAGDGKMAYPRVETLEAIAFLPDAERRAVEEVQAIIREAQSKNHPVYAVTKLAENGHHSVQYPLKNGEYDPAALQFVIAELTIGG